MTVATSTDMIAVVIRCFIPYFTSNTGCGKVEFIRRSEEDRRQIYENEKLYGDKTQRSGPLLMKLNVRGRLWEHVDT